MPLEGLKIRKYTRSRSSILFLILFITFVEIGCRDVWFKTADFVFGLFGDSTFDKTSTPLPPGWNPSGALVVGCISRSEIKRILFVRMLPVVSKGSRQPYVYASSKWGYQYPGFPKVELTLVELDTVLGLFRKGRMFSDFDVPNHLCEDKTIFDARDYPCCEKGIVPPAAYVVQQTIPSLQDRYNELERRARFDGKVAQLQVYLPRRRIALLDIYWDDQTVAFSTGHTYQLPLSGFGIESHSLISSFDNRARVSPVELEFPSENSISALDRGMRKFGKSYMRSVESLRDWEGMDSVFGKIDDIYPAKGLNHKGSWADSSWAEYTFYVTCGEKSGLILISDSSRQLLYDQIIYEF